MKSNQYYWEAIKRDPVRHRLKILRQRVGYQKLAIVRMEREIKRARIKILDCEIEIRALRPKMGEIKSPDTLERVSGESL